MQSGVAKQGKMPHMEPVGAARRPRLEAAAGFAELGGAQQREGCTVRVSREETADLIAAAAVLLDPVLLPSFAIHSEYLVVPSRFGTVSASTDNGRAPGLAAKVRMATAGAVGNGFNNPVLPAASPLGGGRRARLCCKKSNFVFLGGNGLTHRFVGLAKHAGSMRGAAREPSRGVGSGAAVTVSGSGALAENAGERRSAASGTAARAARSVAREVREV